MMVRFLFVSVLLGWRKALMVSCSLALVACTSVNSKVGGVFDFDTDVKITFIVDSDINPDEKNKPSPLFVRFYELKSEKLFKRADFIELYERDEEILGADFVGKQELRRLTPGEDRTERFVVSDEARYIALYAEFFQYKGAKHSVIFPVSVNNVIRNAYKIKISGNSIALAE